MGTIRIRHTSEGVKFEAYSAHGGRNTYLKSWDTRRLAQEAIDDWEAKAREWRRAVERGETTVPLHDIDYTTAVDRFLAHLETPGVDGHKSRRKYGDVLKAHVIPMLGKTPLNAITPERILDWQKATAWKLSVPTANTVLIALKASLTFCVRSKWLATSPASVDAGVKPLAYDRREFQWISSREDVTKLLAHCLEISQDLHDFVAIAVGTGMRLGEILALQWSDVWLDRRLINVHRALKTKKSKRRIPILDAVLPVFQARKLARGEATGLVFVPTERQVRGAAKRAAKAGQTVTDTKRAAIMRERSVFRSQLDSAVIRAGIHQEGMPKLRIHDLRHTFASHWVMDGGDIYRLSKVLGHSTVAITEEYYAHLKPDAWTQDYHRVSFALPTAADNVVSLRAV